MPKLPSISQLGFDGANLLEKYCLCENVKNTQDSTIGSPVPNKYYEDRSSKVSCQNVKKNKETLTQEKKPKVIPKKKSALSDEQIENTIEKVKLRRKAKHDSPPFAYQCKYPTCKRRLNDFEAMKKHVKVHFIRRPHKCNYCSKAFPQRGNLIKHLKLHELPELRNRRQYKCEFCNKRYTEKYNLRAHQDTFHQDEMDDML